MTAFVRISFRSGGRKRACWAEEIRPGAYWRVNHRGERPETDDLILGPPDDFVVRPAKMNLHYAELELATSR